MKLQTHPNACGPACVANVLRAMGRNVTEESVTRKLENQEAIYGTSEGRIFLALDKLKLNYSTLRLDADTGGEAAAFDQLLCALSRGRPVILCVDRLAHWAGAVGRLGERILLVDSAHHEIVLSYNRRDLMARWMHDGENGAAFYGIIVGGPKEFK
jgi:ABC-type bacteriocin/lantibiotic exporter with double-glycine peptidase domain